MKHAIFTLTILLAGLTCLGQDTSAFKQVKLGIHLSPSMTRNVERHPKAVLVEHPQRRVPMNFGFSVEYMIKPHLAIRTGAGFQHLSHPYPTNTRIAPDRAIYPGSKVIDNNLEIPIAITYRWETFYYTFGVHNMVNLNRTSTFESIYVNKNQQLTYPTDENKAPALEVNHRLVNPMVAMGIGVEEPIGETQLAWTLGMNLQFDVLNMYKSDLISQKRMIGTCQVGIKSLIGG